MNYLNEESSDGEYMRLLYAKIAYQVINNVYSDEELKSFLQLDSIINYFIAKEK